MIDVYKISELVGIFEGINFDNSINDTEIAYIKKWIKENKYTAQSRIEIALINLLNSSFDEYEIVDENKEDAATFCNEYTTSQEYVDNISKLFELYGIVLGITCDGIINDMERHELSDWLSKNSKYVFKNKENTHLVGLLGDIYQKKNSVDIIQSKFTQLIQSRLEESKLELKLEYMKQLVREGKNLGSALLDLVSKVNDFKFIHDKAEKILNMYLDSYVSYRSNEWEYIIISLSIMEMLQYSGNFYAVVQSKYSILYELYKDQKIEGTIRDIISLYTNDVKQRRRINAILENTLVPKPYLPDFFDFIYDVYRKNFDSSMPIDVDSEIHNVYQALKSEISDQTDNVIILGKQYNLLKSTRRIMLNSALTDGIVELGVIVMKLIDGYLWGKGNVVDNVYIQYGFEEWQRKYGHSVNKKYVTRHVSDKTVRWKPEFKLVGNHVILCIPVHHIKNCYDYRDIKITLSQNGLVTEYDYTNLPDIRVSKIIGGCNISSQQISLNAPLDYVSYRVIVDNEIKYDSQKELYRDNIIFDEQGNEIRDVINNSDVAVICCRKNLILKKSFYMCESYELFYFDKEISERLAIQNSNAANISSINAYLVGEIVDNCYVYDKTEEKYLKVYRDILSLLVNISGSTEQYEIVIDSMGRKLESLEYNDISRNRININLQALHVGIGIHRIFLYKLNQSSRVCVFKEKFAIDDIIFSSQQITDRIYTLKFASSICPYKLNDFEIDIKNYNSDMLCFEYDVDLCTYTYFVPFDFRMYRLDGGEWCSFEEYLWGGRIKSFSQLEVWGIEYEKIEINSSDNAKILQNIYCEEKKDGDISSIFEIGVIKSYAERDKITLHFDNGHDLHCYNRCVLKKSSTVIRYESLTKQMLIIPVYWGEDELLYHVYLDEAIIASGTLKNRKEELINNILPFKKYQICIFGKSRSWLSQKYKLLDIEKSFFSVDDLQGRIFRINSLLYSHYIKRYDEMRNDKINVKNTYIHYINKCDAGKYTAEILKKRKYGEYYPMRNITTIKVEICGMGMGKSIDLYLTTMDEDGLYFDSKSEGILDSLFDKKADDIYLVTMNTEQIEGNL